MLQEVRLAAALTRTSLNDLNHQQDRWPPLSTLYYQRKEHSGRPALLLEIRRHEETGRGKGNPVTVKICVRDL